MAAPLVLVLVLLVLHTIREEQDEGRKKKLIKCTCCSASLSREFSLAAVRSCGALHVFELWWFGNCFHFYGVCTPVIKEPNLRDLIKSRPSSAFVFQPSTEYMRKITYLLEAADAASHTGPRFYVMLNFPCTRPCRAMPICWPQTKLQARATAHGSLIPL